MHLFTYGTLMDSVIMDRVAGEVFESSSAVLPGYFRKQVVNAVFPAIAPKEAEQVEGVLYLNLTLEAIERLDRFEGELYHRSPVTIHLGNDHWLDAHSYVIKPELVSMMSEHDWHLDRFKEQHRHYFKNEYEGFRKLDEV